MKRSKYILYIWAIGGILAFTGCNDFLDRSPQGQFTEDDNPGALAEGKIFNIYTMMRNFNITAGTPAFAIHCFRSEDSEKGSISSDGSEQAAMYDDFQYNASNGLIKAYWSQNYAIIYQCNEGAFKAAAALQHTTPERALAGMLAKHIVSLYDMCFADGMSFDAGTWDEKITDSLNYLFLLKAIVKEGQTNQQN